MSRWAADIIWPGGGKSFGECVCLGVLEKGKAIACIVYHNFDPDAGIIEFSGAATSKRWLTRDVLQEMFDYPFARCGLQMVVTQNSAREHQSHLHRMLNRVGFRSHLIERLRGKDEDGYVWTLTDDDWRKCDLNRTSGNEQTKSPDSA